MVQSLLWKCCRFSTNQQIVSEAGKPQSHGIIERANATIKDLIHKSIELIDNFDWVKN
jgi:hypothetical protein